MEKRQLGKDGDHVSVIGFGAWPIGGAMGAVDEGAAIATVHAVLDHGITLIDTAQSYRTSEADYRQSTEEWSDGIRFFSPQRSAVTIRRMASGVRWRIACVLYKQTM